MLGQLAIFSSVYAFRDLGFKAQMAAWLGMTAAISRLGLSPLAGWLTDRWGAKPSLMLWTATAGIGFLLLATWPNPISVFIAAGIAAVAYSGFSGAMNALTSGIPQPHHRAGHFTLLGFCMITANSCGPMVIGWLFDHVVYRAGFAILAAISVVVTTIAAYLLRNLSPRAEDYI